MRLNGEEISLTDRLVGKQLFLKPSKSAIGSAESATVSSDPPTPQQRSAVAGTPAKVRDRDKAKSLRALSSSAGAALASVSVAEIFSSASDVEAKTLALDHAWKALLASIVQVRRLLWLTGHHDG